MARFGKDDLTEQLQREGDAETTSLPLVKAIQFMDVSGIGLASK